MLRNRDNLKVFTKFICLLGLILTKFCPGFGSPTCREDTDYKEQEEDQFQAETMFLVILSRIGVILYIPPYSGKVQRSSSILRLGLEVILYSQIRFRGHTQYSGYVQRPFSVLRLVLEVFIHTQVRLEVIIYTQVRFRGHPLYSGQVQRSSSILRLGLEVILYTQVRFRAHTQVRF